MIKVQTRENSRGRYWCNATVKGYDVTVEASTPEFARRKFEEETGLTDDEIEFLAVKPYPQKPVFKKDPFLITPQKVRIDFDPQG
jgi:hypothetical protein